MPVPKRKWSKSRTRSRQANKGVKVVAFAVCTNCSESVSSHTACQGCGFYKGKKVIETKADRAVKRAGARSEKETKQEAVRKKLEASGKIPAAVEEPKKAE